MLVTFIEDENEVDPEIDVKEEKFELIRELKTQTNEILKELWDETEQKSHDIEFLSKRAQNLSLKEKDQDNQIKKRQDMNEQLMEEMKKMMDSKLSDYISTMKD